MVSIPHRLLYHGTPFLGTSYHTQSTLLTKPGNRKVGQEELTFFAYRRETCTGRERKLLILGYLHWYSVSYYRHLLVTKLSRIALV